MSTPHVTIDHGTGRLTLHDCDPDATHQVQGQVLVELVAQVNAGVESRARSSEAEAVAVLVRATGSVSVVRATPRAIELSKAPGASSPQLGEDVVNLSLRLRPADADRLLAWCAGRTS